MYISALKRKKIVCVYMCVCVAKERTQALTHLLGKCYTTELYPHLFYFETGSKSPRLLQTCDPDPPTQASSVAKITMPSKKGNSDVYVTTW